MSTDSSIRRAAATFVDAGQCFKEYEDPELKRSKGVSEHAKKNAE